MLGVEEFLLKIGHLLLVVCCRLRLDLLHACFRLRLELLHASHFRLSVGDLGVGFICHGINFKQVLSGLLLDGSDGVDCLVVLLLVMCGSVVGVLYRLLDNMVCVGGVVHSGGSNEPFVVRKFSLCVV